MTDTELTILSTVAWLIATAALFILLGHWSTGASWGLTATLVNGLRSWSAGDGAAARRAATAGGSPGATLAPMPNPPIAAAGIRRAALGRAPVQSEGPGPASASQTPGPADETAELVDLGERPARGN